MILAYEYRCGARSTLSLEPKTSSIPDSVATTSGVTLGGLISLSFSPLTATEIMPAIPQGPTKTK